MCCTKALDIQNWLDEAIRQSVSMPKLDQKIAALEERLQQLNQQTSSRRHVGEIWLGRSCWLRANRGLLEESVLRAWLEAGLTETEDRELFGL